MSDFGTSVADRALFNVLLEGIIEDIRFALENKRYRATVVLIYSGIDAMATLDRPEKAEEVNRECFINWTETYMHFNSGSVSGIELYSARCAMLHNYGVCSRLTNQGIARKIGYVDNSALDVMASPEVKGLLLLSIHGLADAFIKGVANYLKMLEAQSDKRKLVAGRLIQMVHIIPLATAS
jgi:hypothetical protein